MLNQLPLKNLFKRYVVGKAKSLLVVLNRYASHFLFIFYKFVINNRIIKISKFYNYMVYKYCIEGQKTSFLKAHIYNGVFRFFDKITSSAVWY